MGEQYDVPIAFFVFNRPAETQKVFEAIAAVRPKTLLIISDGARPSRPDEKSRVEEVRSIVSKVNWPCDVQVNFSDTNQGCKKRVSSGIDWIFSLVDQAIILEDDCLPTTAFFSYCQDMLTIYRDNLTVYSISGTCFLQNNHPNGHYMSDYALMWGWATWRNRWEKYQVAPDNVYRTVLRKWWRQPLTLVYWLLIFSNLQNDRIDTWDYQWILTVWRHRGLVVRPDVNLIQNIGFGENATHTTDNDHFVSTLKAWNGEGDFKLLLGRHEAQKTHDAIDEKVWAGIGWKAPILIVLSMIREKIRAFR